ncbi:uncharacterized protein LOC143539664 [Bidens hawaiensis]|uniref:uncharacterized protein LOC143539664 n=1 Tax=Bidens hawaiensis TaxID=980011 RepID=UPI004049CC49
MVEADAKLHLIKRICDVSNHAKSCAHHDTFDSDPFIDWYILLQVEDNVSLDMIRKKYHKYALLLHPDKNKHPEAEFAFKLVSAAYACLSDKAKRLDFDVKRWDNVCWECIRTQESRNNVKGSSSPSNRSRSKKIPARVKEVKARFMEEARVIEGCLKANSNIDVSEKQIPVFNPNDYGNKGYPHFRVWRCNELKNSKWLKKRFVFDNQEQHTKVKCNSPIFECNQIGHHSNFSPS